MFAYEQLLTSLDQLRENGALGRNKLRLSVRDIARGSGVPKSSVATYLAGAIVMPLDQFDAIVRCLEVDEGRLDDWSRAWHRASTERRSGETVRPPEDPGSTAARRSDVSALIRNQPSRRPVRWATFPIAILLITVAALAYGIGRLGRPGQAHGSPSQAAVSHPYPVPPSPTIQRCSAPLAGTDGVCVVRDGSYMSATFYAEAPREWTLTMQQCWGDATHCLVVAATSEQKSLRLAGANGHLYRAIATWTDRHGQRQVDVTSPAVALPMGE